MMNDEAERRRLILRCGFAGTAVMALPLAIFSVWSLPLVRLFLSDAFVPAIPAIRTYMMGDMIRIWISLAAFSAFAAGSPARCAAVELATLAIMAATTMIMIRLGSAEAPQLGYLIACATVAGASLSRLLWREYQDRTASITADTA
jgi:hypothetical protein